MSGSPGRIAQPAIGIGDEGNRTQDNLVCDDVPQITRRKPAEF
jgi:hypothetical protein